MNKREEVHFVMERIDRAFASVDWINSYPNYAFRNLPITKSDHGPVVQDFDFQHSFRMRPFRFEHMWTSHPLCKDAVKQAWDYRSIRSRAYQLRNKLSNVRKTFLIWNKEVFGRVEQDINHKKEQLKRLQNSIINLDDVKKENELREDLETLMNREEVMWSHKARCN